MIFGQDGWLYLGVGAVTDRSEGANPQAQAYDPLTPLEAAVLRINPHTLETSVYANGIRNPFDVAQDSRGLFYATDTGVVSGAGDRVLQLSAGGFYGFPYYRARGCNECPPSMGAGSFLPDLLPLRDYSLPRGLVAYTGQQYPANLWDTLFVVLWNGTDYAQRIIWFDPNQPPTDTAPLTFLSGLVRPIDLTLAPDGSLVVADFIYGHIWRIVYVGDAVPNTPSGLSFLTPTALTATPAATAAIVRTVAPLGFATNTPSP
jgi:glucose/arabinose dehydrogenase